ncbi:acetamidase/formamidase family protein [Comamonas sp. JC664]|uniref:acetamidase/formamidase family protein n=1 Tax=Comamonas sp. JC664 TaxID=2801917 RepID=UPI00174D6172|nr:acetamidase/formamidase family protein [Comamonas sp. JC664]MBL0695646.1 acetamidase/formamidase family protein [Comamonas sp. JC664]GHG62716.1 hypothetical protein GCM10012319_01640 [Comamonas sp. KCTC 72670]
MPKLLPLLLCLIPATLLAQPQPREEWVLTTRVYGNLLHQRLWLEREGTRLRGSLDGDPLEGQSSERHLRFVVTARSGARYAYSATQHPDGLTGEADWPGTNDPKARVSHPFTARAVPMRPPGPPRHHDFEPTTFSNTFSADLPPVLTLWPGDSVRTRTLDSGGVDAQGVTRALFGNPQTGPFYVGTAADGDTLVIHLKRLRLNRDTADSLDDLVGRAMGPRLAAKAHAQGLGKPIRWKLDRKRGIARPESPSPRMKDFTVPLRPMLGGLAVAPAFGFPPASTGDSGRFGGNMDFNELVEGNTVYLPVSQPGALLYLGDAHAAQGDGETSQFALETSMEVEFAVDVLPGKSIATPRIESPTHIIALGQAGSLDDALRVATAGLTQWLEQDYGLSLSDCAQVLGTSAQFRVANLAGRNVGVAASLEKQRLARLKPSPNP